MAGSISGENMATAVDGGYTTAVSVSTGTTTATARLFDTLTPFAKTLVESGGGSTAMVASSTTKFFSETGYGSDLLAVLTLRGYAIGYLHGYAGPGNKTSGYAVGYLHGYGRAGSKTFTHSGTGTDRLSVSKPTLTLTHSATGSDGLSTARVLQSAGVTTALTGLVSGTQYTVTVRAYDAAGNRSAASVALVFTTS